jgi:hypothetical protein
VGTFPLARYNQALFDTGSNCPVTSCYILLDEHNPIIASFPGYRYDAIHVPAHERFKLADVVPGALWDETDRLFLKPKLNRGVVASWPMVLAMRFRFFLSPLSGRNFTQVVVLCDYRLHDPVVKIFRKTDYLRAADILFHDRYKEKGIWWDDLESQAPELQPLDSTLIVNVDGCPQQRIELFWQEREFSILSEKIPTRSLMFSVTKLREDVPGYGDISNASESSDNADDDTTNHPYLSGDSRQSDDGWSNDTESTDAVLRYPRKSRRSTPRRSENSFSSLQSLSEAVISC